MNYIPSFIECLNELIKLGETKKEGRQEVWVPGWNTLSKQHEIYI